MFELWQKRDSLITNDLLTPKRVCVCLISCTPHIQSIKALWKKAFMLSRVKNVGRRDRRTDRQTLIARP